MKTLINERRGVVACRKDKFWGIQYEDGYSTSYAYGPPKNATISDPRFCKKPTDLTYKDSPYIRDLEEGELVPVVETVYWEKT